jgi:flagellar motor protein MotB
MEKMKQKLHESLKEINTEKIQQDIERSRKHLEKVDMEKTRENLDRALSKLRSQDVQKLIEESMSKVNMEEMRSKMERVQEEMEKNKDKMKFDLEKAKENLKKAKTELKAYQEMIEDMENDGLIDTHEDYKIQFKNNELFINGKRQSSEVTDKYRKYFKEDTVIEKQGGNMNINRNSEGTRRRTVSI